MVGKVRRQESQIVELESAESAAAVRNSALAADYENVSHKLDEILHGITVSERWRAPGAGPVSPTLPPAPSFQIEFAVRLLHKYHIVVFFVVVILYFGRSKARRAINMLASLRWSARIRYCFVRPALTILRVLCVCALFALQTCMCGLKDVQLTALRAALMSCEAIARDKTHALDVSESTHSATRQQLEVQRDCRLRAEAEAEDSRCALRVREIEAIALRSQLAKARAMVAGLAGKLASAEERARDLELSIMSLHGGDALLNTV